MGSHVNRQEIIVNTTQHVLVELVRPQYVELLSLEHTQLQLLSYLPHYVVLTLIRAHTSPIETYSVLLILTQFNLLYATVWETVHSLQITTTIQLPSLLQVHYQIRSIRRPFNLLILLLHWVLFHELTHCPFQWIPPLHR